MKAACSGLGCMPSCTNARIGLVSRPPIFLMRGRKTGAGLHGTVFGSHDQHLQVGRAETLETCDPRRTGLGTKVLGHDRFEAQCLDRAARGVALGVEAEMSELMKTFIARR